MGLLRWTARRCAALYLVVVYVGVGAVSPVWDERDVLLHAVAQRTIDAFSSLSIPENAGLFGSAVDVDVASGIAVVGAPTGDSNRGASWSSWYSTNKNTMGTAFAFERQPDGSWIQTFEFVPELAEDTECVPWPRPDPTPGGCQTNFGKAVAVDANRVLIGAGGGSSSQGAVYVFERQASGTWLQTAVLRSLANSEQEAGLGSWQGQSFGHSVALDGDTALVGEPGSDRIHWTEIGENLHPSPKSKVGHVYAFECQADGTWLRKDRFSDQSGRDAATGRIMSGPSIIGSQGSGPGEGFFGASVALDDNRAIIGAAQGALGNREDPVGGLFGCPSQAYGCQNRGHAYIFERQSDGTWLQTFPELGTGLWRPDDNEEGDQFGTTVDIQGDRAVVGAYLAEGNQEMPNTGAVYIFQRQETEGQETEDPPAVTWSQTDKLEASSAAPGDQFGVSVSLQGDSVLIGANKVESSTGAAGAGVAYMFEFDGNAWTQTSIFEARGVVAGDSFGLSVALDVGLVLIGADGTEGGDSAVSANNAGSAYVFAPCDGHDFSSTTELAGFCCDDFSEEPSVVDGSCASCSGSLQADCTSASCSSGFIPWSSTGGVCCNSFATVESVVDGSCISCSDSSPSGCLAATCKIGYHSFGEGECCRAVVEERHAGSCRCTAGFYFDQTQGQCAQCDPGMTSADDRLSCIPCGATEYTPSVGVCIECAVGKVPTASGGDCEACAAGKTSAGGSCVPCAAGEYSQSGLCIECAVGKVPTASGGDCETCAAGMTSAGGSCVPCAAGEYSQIGLCFACPAGKVPSSHGADCEDCPENQLARPPEYICRCRRGSYNMSAVRPSCFTGDYVPQDTQKASRDVCVSCSDLECISDCHDEWLLIDAGWSPFVPGASADDLRLPIFKCKYNESTPSCLGGIVSSGNGTHCAEGYTGPLCGACSADFTLRSDGSCDPCGATTMTSAVIVSIVALVVLVVLAKTVPIWFNYLSILQQTVLLARTLRLKAMSKILVATMQILGNIAAVLNIRLPEIFTNFLASFVSFFTFDIISMFKLGCIGHDGSYTAVLATAVSIVLVVIVVVGLIYLHELQALNRADQQLNDEEVAAQLHKLYKSFDKDGDGIQLNEVRKIVAKIEPTTAAEDVEEIFRKADADGSGIISFEEFHAAVSADDSDESIQLDLGILVKKKAKHKIRDDATGRLFLVVFLLYPSLTNRIFDGFACRTVGEDASILNADYAVDCESPDYQILFYACVALTLIWPVGVPGFLFYSLYRERKEIMDDDVDALQKFDFVLGDYDKQHWYWEIVELIRKLILAGLIGFVGRGSVLQTVVALVISFMFFALTFREMPYNNARLNIMKVLSEVQIFGVLLICVVLQSVNGLSTEILQKEEYGYCQIFLTAAIMPVTLWVMHKNLVDLKEQAHEDLGQLQKDKGGDGRVVENVLHDGNSEIQST